MSRIIFPLLILLSTFYVNAQNKKIKFGVPSLEELQMNTYIKDSTTSAVVLYEYGNAAIKYLDGGVNLFIEYTTRIKILKKEALDRADIVVPLRKSSTSRKAEIISDIKAVSTTLTSSGVQKKWLTKDAIYKEDSNDNYRLTKFAIPNVKVGSVIEYRYTIISPFLFNFHDWEFQIDIPKIYSEYNTSIPANYRYNIKLIGSEKMDTNESNLKRSCFIIEPLGKADCVLATYIMKDIPPFIEEDFMLSAKNFKSKISFELQQVEYFNGKKEKYTKTWKNVDNELRVGENLGSQGNKGSYFKKRMPQNVLLLNDPLKKAKKKIYHLQEKLTWNEKYNLFGKKSVKKVYEEKSGSSTELNLILLNHFKAAGLNANLMLLSTRQNGLPTKLYPVLSEFNYLIIKLDINNVSYLIDITDKRLPFGLLPYRCLNGYGRVFDFKKGSYWYSINADKYKTKSITQMFIKIADDATINGRIRKINTGYFGLDKRNEINKKGKESYIDNLEDQLSKTVDFEITDFEFTNRDNYEESMIEVLSFKINEDSSSENIFLYPFIFNRFGTNPFKLENRTYPVNFGHPFSYSYQITIEINETMKFIDMFDNKNIITENGLATLNLISVQ